MKRNYLSQASSYRLTKYLDTPRNRAKLIADDDADMAAVATKELGFTVSPLNITFARKTLGIRKRSKRGSGRKSAALAAKITTLEERVAKLEELVTRPTA